MEMSRRVRLPGTKADDENQDLKNLLERYMRRSEELETRENSILRQMEIVQSAVASLREWSENRKSAAEAVETVRMDPEEIENETRLIKEETERIQEEIEQKILENKLLREEVLRRKMGAVEKCDFNPLRKDNHVTIKGEDIQCRDTKDSSMDYFRGKLKRLKEMQRSLKEESRMKVDETKRRKRDLIKKIDELEAQLEEDRNIVESMRKDARNMTM